MQPERLVHSMLSCVVGTGLPGRGVRARARVRVRVRGRFARLESPGWD